jgi:hypothetical protein
MTSQSAGPGRSLGRVCALAAALFVLISAANCSRETFYLLSSGGSTSIEAGSSAPGAANSAVAGTGGDSSASPPGPDVSNGGNVGAAGDRDAAANGGGSGRPSGGFHGSVDDSCSSGETCVDGGVPCPPNLNFCKRCQTPSDCPRDSAMFCDVADGHCAECDPQQDTCPQGEICDSLFRRCAKTCRHAAASSTGTCDGPQHFCWPSRNVCVDCTVDSECAVMAGHEHFVCFLGFCVECFDNSACKLPGHICQAYKCVAK